jgi:putative DNA primase/helicase
MDNKSRTAPQQAPQGSNVYPLRPQGAPPLRPIYPPEVLEDLRKAGFTPPDPSSVVNHPDLPQPDNIGDSLPEPERTLFRKAQSDPANGAKPLALLKRVMDLRRDADALGVDLDLAGMNLDLEEPPPRGLSADAADVTPITSKKKRGAGPVDDAIADAFAEEHRNDLRYVAKWGKWFEWRNGCWREENTLKVFNLIRKTCKARGIERASMSNMVAAVHMLVRADRRIAATVEQWDADPMLLNTPGGVVNLKTGETRRHRPDDYMTKITAVAPRGDCPKWKAFLRRIMRGDAELIAYLRRVCGYSLTGDTGEQAMFFGYGTGANGKGVLLQTISRIMLDYAKTAAIETFTESKTDRHPTELARLHNARLVTATETEKGRNWAESRIKMLTGGDTVTAHFMRQNDFQYVPLFKLFFSGNHKPGVRSVGEAMRRRLNMIPFEVIIPKGERDPHFVDSLKDEWPGILQWMIEGGFDWQKQGLAPPLAVTEATDAYFETQDSFSQWIEDRCERNPNTWTMTSALFASWKDWADKAGVHHGDIKGFGEAMEAAGFHFRRRAPGAGYDGLRVAVEPAPPHWQDDRG